MIAALLSYLRPRVGRFTHSQTEHLGQYLAPPAYLALGPFLVLVDLPERFQAKDPVLSLEDINAALQAAVGQLRAGIRPQQ